MSNCGCRGFEDGLVDSLYILRLGNKDICNMTAPGLLG